LLQTNTVKEKFRYWTENNYFDQKTRQELLDIDDMKETEDRFYADLEFGTGGMRGVIGAGTNRINKYVIRKITQGLADTIREHGVEACQRGVVIACDSRYCSADFALETALVLSANDIRAFLFDDIRPTPELSFAVRYLKAIAGVNITASHNPREYNGYKVYWEDGSQVPPDKANQIIARINGRHSWVIDTLDIDKALKSGLIQSIGQEIDEAWFKEIKKLLLFPQLTKERGLDLKIVYTPLHGTGNIPVRKLLQELGFSSLFVVPEQEKPDCEFPTVKSPNPEDPQVFDLALKYALNMQADIILATDPDADRLGLYARDREGSFKRFTGNQIGVILEYFLLSKRREMGTLPEDARIVKTVVTTELGDAVAGHFGVKTVNVLVGFKYIGEQIKDMEEKASGTYIFGFEESHGYLAGTYARDKDAVQAAALIAEAALYYREKEKKTLPEVLEEIFGICGYYMEEQHAISLQGKDGKENIIKIMEKLRSEKIKICGEEVIRNRDDFLTRKTYFLQEEHEVSMEQAGQSELPRENALRFTLKGGGFIIARPSGTEPKIRFYFCIRKESPQKLSEAMDKVKTDFLKKISDFCPDNTSQKEKSC